MPQPDFERRRTLLQPVRIERRCGANDCQGFMVYNGHAVTMLETDYQHQCDTCGRFEWFDLSYPRIEYENA